MPMPEAAMHQDDLPPGSEHQIWLARQIPSVEPVADTKTAHSLSD
jgi:hypothetical protein